MRCLAVLVLVISGCLGLGPAVRVTIDPESTGTGTVVSSPDGIECGQDCASSFDGKVTLRATAAEGSRFVGWSGACSGSEPTCVIVPNADSEVSARFEAVLWPVTVTRSGTGRGTIRSRPDGIVCGETCTAMFPEGAKLFLSATADDGSLFTGWTSGCTGGGECELRVTEPMTIAAGFDIAPRPTLTIDTVGAGKVIANTGGIDCGESCSASFPVGQVVTLTAVADDYAMFLGWSEPSCAGNLCTLTLGTDRTVTARFTPPYCPATFTSVVGPSVGTWPDAVALGDLDGDGNLDAVVGNHHDADISVLRGKGDRTFQPRVDYAAPGGYPFDVAIADLDGDGKLDVVSANLYFLGVHLGNGDGTLKPIVTYSNGDIPHTIEIADLDNDGVLDLVAASANNGPISVLRGKGDGTFFAATTYVVGPYPFNTAIADLDGDGLLDIAVAIGNAQRVELLRNTGNGTFAWAGMFPVATQGGPYGIAAGDLDGDGDADLVAVGIGGAYLLRNNGGLSFASAQQYMFGDGFEVLLADMTGDSIEDLVMTTGYNTVGVFRGTGDSMIWGASHTMTVSNGPEAIAVGDLDNDGDLDIVNASQQGTTLDVFENQLVCP